MNKASGKNISQIRVLLILLIAVWLTVFLVHSPALSSKALSFDDDQYLTDNELVRNPSFKSAGRFLTEILEPSTVAGYYQPLTMISLMIDCACGGSNDNLKPFHWTSLILHATNTALIIVLLYMLMDSAIIAAMAGLLFGLHPMTVEVIPWVGERKTLLAAFFAISGLIFYVRYVRTGKKLPYLAALLMYLLAMLSKPTSVAMPAMLLLMDFWPLARLSSFAKIKQLVLEKLPFFIIGISLAIVMYISQARTAAVTLPTDYGPQRIPLFLCHNIIFYLYKMVWPVNLSSHYPIPAPLALSNTMVLAGVIGTSILLPVLILSLKWTRSLLTGWLFFFLAIFPTMGVIGFTNVIASDKYAYLPAIGLLMILAAFLKYCYRGKKQAVIIAMVLLLATLESVGTRRYLNHWKDTITLFQRMLKITPDSAILHSQFGAALVHENRLDEAAVHFRRTLEIEPNRTKTLFNLGITLMAQGEIDQAVKFLRQAIKLDPGYSKARQNLAMALQLQGKYDEAKKYYDQVSPDKLSQAQMYNKLGSGFLKQGKIDEAVKYFERAVRLNPGYAMAYYNLAVVYSKQKKFDQAIGYYERSLQLKPGYVSALKGLGTVLMAQGKVDPAISQWQKALQFKPDDVAIREKLAHALIQTEDFRQAAEHYRQMLKVKPDSIGALTNLAWILAAAPDASLRNVNEAIILAQRAAEVTKFKNPRVLNVLSTAYASADMLDKAIATAEKALARAKAANDAQLVAIITKSLGQYKQKAQQ